MNPLQERLQILHRRQFLGRSANVIGGGLAAASFAGLAQASSPDSNEGLHFAPRAKRIIYLFMEGGPSQIDTFDHKPMLRDLHGKDLRKMPEVQKGQRLTGMTSGQSTLPLHASPFTFQRYANNSDGIFLPDELRHTGGVAEDLCVVRSVHTEAINHGPAVTMMQTGSQLAGRPSMGAWLSYGLGSPNKNLPDFVVLVSKGVGQMQALLSRYWGSGFLPSQHQGVRLRGGKEAVLFLNDPAGMNRSDRRAMLDIVSELNSRDAERNGDAEIHSRVSQYEMAFRMQTAVPELTDLSTEGEATLEMYGPDVRTPGSFASNCLLARRLAEQGTRFIQLYHRGWDAHGNIPKDIPSQCRDVDQAQTALITDLKRRGLLDDTLVIWGGEFGRTSYAQGPRGNVFGRDHHPRCFSIWMAGGGVRPGITYGQTDEVGYNIVEGHVHIHDLHATVLHLLGIDHEQLTFRYQGRDFRLTDVHGDVVEEILS